MKIEDVKIDGRYRVQKKYENQCGAYSTQRGDSIVITNIKFTTAIDGGDMEYDICTKNGDAENSCEGCFKPHMLVPYIPEEATMEAEVEPIYIWTGKKLYMVDDLGRHELTDKIYTSD